MQSLNNFHSQSPHVFQTARSASATGGSPPLQPHNPTSGTNPQVNSKQPAAHLDLAERNQQFDVYSVMLRARKDLTSAAPAVLHALKYGAKPPAHLVTQRSHQAAKNHFFFGPKFPAEIVFKIAQYLSPSELIIFAIATIDRCDTEVSAFDRYDIFFGYQLLFAYDILKAICKAQLPNLIVAPESTVSLQALHSTLYRQAFIEYNLPLRRYTTCQFGIKDDPWLASRDTLNSVRESVSYIAASRDITLYALKIAGKRKLVMYDTRDAEVTSRILSDCEWLVNGAAASDDGSTLIASVYDADAADVKIWKKRGSEFACVVMEKGTDDRICNPVAMSLDGTVAIFFNKNNNELIVYQIDDELTNIVRHPFPFKVVEPLYGLARNGSTIAVVTQRHGIIVFAPETVQDDNTFIRIELENASTNVLEIATSVRELYLSPNGNFLIVEVRDLYKLYDLRKATATNACVSCRQWKYIDGPKFSEDGRYVAFVTDDACEVAIIDLYDSKAKTKIIKGVSLFAIDFSPQANRCLTQSKKTIQIWDINDDAQDKTKQGVTLKLTLEAGSDVHQTDIVYFSAQGGHITCMDTNTSPYAVGIMTRPRSFRRVPRPGLVLQFDRPPEQAPLPGACSSPTVEAS